MSRKERRPARVDRIRALVEAGDHGAARAEARAVLADAGAPPEERAGAAGVLASLAPERGALVAGAVGAAAAVAISVLVLLRG
jgi:hypothetical protein